MEKITVGVDQGSYTVTNGARTITLSGLSFTPTIEQLAYVYNITQQTLYYAPAGTLAKCTLSGNVITIDSTFSTLVTGDEIHIQMFVDQDDLDSSNVYVENPNHAHYTSVEHLIDESDIGLTGAFDGAEESGSVFIDSSETYTLEDVAEGYMIYNVTDTSSGSITSDSLNGLAGDTGVGYSGSTASGSAITPTSMSGGTDNYWDTGDVANIPQCKRFVIPVEGYNYTTFDILLDSQNEYNSVYCKVYSTLDDNADDTEDTYWKDQSTDILGAAQLSADGISGGTRAVTQGVYTVDIPTPLLKYMVKVVAECSTGSFDNEFDIRIKKSS